MTAVTETTETTAPAPKRRGRPRKDEAANVPPLDLSKLTVKTGVSMPKQERAKQDNPFIQHVQDSFENDDAMAVEVPEEQAKRIESLIRRAADILTEMPGAQARVGVTVHVSEPNEGMVTITFAAKERRARKSNAEAQAEATEATEKGSAS
jgi:hypothetical protein